MAEVKCPECGFLFKHLDRPVPHPRPFGLTSSLRICGISGNPTFNSYKMNEFDINTGVGPTRFVVNYSSPDNSSKHRDPEFTSYDCCLFTDRVGIGIEWPALLMLRVGEDGDDLSVSLVADGKLRFSFKSTEHLWIKMSPAEVGLAASIADIYVQRLSRLDERTGNITTALARFLELIRKCINEQYAEEAERGVAPDQSKVISLMPYVKHNASISKLLESWCSSDRDLEVRTSKHAIVADYREVHRAACGCFFPGKVDLPSIGPRGEKMQPLRLYDTETKSVILGNERETTDDAYCCLSYPWADYNDAQLKEVCATYFETTNSRYFWVDRWCIDQKNDAEKEKEIPKMFNYYNSADSVLILPAVKLPELDHLILKEGSLIRMTADMAQIAQAWKVAPWLQRCWTFQEAKAAKNCAVWTGSDKKRFVDLKTILAIVRASEMGHSFALNSVIATACTETGPSQVPFGVCDSGGVEAHKPYSMNAVRCISHGQVTYEEAYKKPLRELMDMLIGRNATVELDEYYCLFSMATETNLPTVDYGQSVEALVSNLIQTGALSTNVLLTSLRASSWVPKRCSERQFSVLAKGLNTIKPTLRDGSFYTQVSRFFLQDEHGVTHRPEKGRRLPCLVDIGERRQAAKSTAELQLDDDLPERGDMYVLKPEIERSYVFEDVIVVKAIEAEVGKLRILGVTSAVFNTVGYNWRPPATIVPLGHNTWREAELFFEE